MSLSPIVAQFPVVVSPTAGTRPALRFALNRNDASHRDAKSSAADRSTRRPANATIPRMKSNSCALWTNTSAKPGGSSRRGAKCSKSSRAWAISATDDSGWISSEHHQGDVVVLRAAVGVLFDVGPYERPQFRGLGRILGGDFA